MRIAAVVILSILLLATFAASDDDRPEKDARPCPEAGRIGKLESEIGELREDVAALRRELGRQREILTLLFKDPPGIPARLGPEPIPKIDAKVKAVNQDLNIVILNVGSDDKVKPGYEFTIYRDTEYVATVVIDKVERGHCSGYSKREIEKSPIEVGDLAATRL